MKRFLKFLGLVGLAVVALGVFATLRTPGHLFALSGTFAGCPVRPSCVSSKATDPVHQIAPWTYPGDAAAARAKLEAIVRAQPLTSIEHATPEYLHAVFQTPTMRFHDDVEFLVEPGGVIQVRSISRFGYRDRGVNRERVERLRAAFNAS